MLINELLIKKNLVDLSKAGILVKLRKNLVTIVSSAYTLGVQ